MAAEEHLNILRQGAFAWNDWRRNHPGLNPILRGADLRKVDLISADLSDADLSGADLRGAELGLANLSKASLSGANLNGAILFHAKLNEAHLRQAHLRRGDLRWADLSGADVSEADLWGALLIGTDLRDATLNGSRVYGAAVWDIKVNEGTEQQNLIITNTPPDRNPDDPCITVDNLKVAQFIYLLLDNQEIREVIDTITSKAVLILGRFSQERKPLLDALREELRKHDYLPILFDFAPEANRSTIETVTTLARMARFVVADLTDARSVLQELQAIVPDLPSLAVRLMIKRSQHEYGMLDYIRKFASVVGNTYEYESSEEVITSIKEEVIGPAEEKVKDLRRLH